MIGLYSIGDMPIGEVDASLSVFQQAALLPVADRVYCLEVEVSPTVLAGATADGTMGDWPIGDTLAAFNALSAGTLYYSDRGYISLPSDTLSNVYFDGRLKVPLSIDRSIPLSPLRGNRVSLQLGAITVNNLDRELDNVAQNYSVDGRRVVVKMGLQGQPYGEFGTVFSGVSANWLDDEREVRIVVRDTAYKMYTPLQASLYLGTGGAEGNSNIQGQPKPMAFGKVLNLSPVLVDPSNNIYQFHSRLAQAVDAVYDQGAALTPAADYANYAALAAASISAGTFGTCLAEGLVKTGSNPVGVLTMDVRGDANVSYVDTAGAIAKRMLIDFGSVSSSDITTSFETVDTNTIGWYSGSNSYTVYEAVNEIMGGVCAWWGNNRLGQYISGIISAPDPTDLIADLDVSDIIDVEQINLPDELDPPVYRWRLGYQRNWTVQRGEDLAGSVTQTRKQFLKDEARVATATDPTVAVTFSLAQDAPLLQTLYDSSSVAQSKADSLLALYKVRRQFLKVTLRTQVHLYEPNQNIEITWPRFGLATGKVFRIIGIGENCETRQGTLVLWG